MGVPQSDCLAVGQLIGKKTMLNEFIAFNELGAFQSSDICSNYQTGNSCIRAVSPKRSEACGDNAKAGDAMREGPSWIAITSVTARASASVHTAPQSSGNVDHGLQFHQR